MIIKFIKFYNNFISTKICDLVVCKWIKIKLKENCFFSEKKE